MINITRNEEVVLNQIKIFNIEYPEGIPLKLLKSELGFHEYDLVQILEELQDKDLIIFKNNKASLSESEKSGVHDGQGVSDQKKGRIDEAADPQGRNSGHPRERASRQRSSSAGRR